MKNVKDYLLNTLKRKSTYFLAGTVALNLIALILYLNFGTSVFVPKLSGGVIAFLVLGTVLPFLAAFSPVKLAYVVLYVINLFACFEFLAAQASFIANVFVGIDGTFFSGAFICIVLFTLAAAVLSLVAMIFVNEQEHGASEIKAEEAANEGI